MARKSVLIVLIVIAVSACKKKYYPNDEVVGTGDVIAFNGSIGGKEVALNIGTNNYYCFTAFQHRIDGVLEFSSLLAPYNCSTCASSFLMTLADVAPSNAGVVLNADSSFKIGKRNLTAGLTEIPLIRLTSGSNKAVQKAEWRLQGKTVGLNSITEQEIFKQGFNTLQLTVLTESNCENTCESKIWVESNGDVFFAEFTSLPQTGTAVKFASTSEGGSGAYTYLWKFGDGENSSESNPTHVFKYKGTYPVQLQITDANGRSVTTTCIVVAGNDPSSCALGMDLQALSKRSVKYSAVNLEWRDEQNRLYSTNAIEQPSTSFFEIVASKPFENNERGEKGRLLTIRFSVLLSDGTQAIQAHVEKATMAVSYK